MMTFKHRIPLSWRMALARLRAMRSLADLTGRRGAAGMRAYLAPGVQSNRWSQVRVGSGVHVLQGTSLHVNDCGARIRITLGDRAYVGPNCFFSAGDLIDVKRDVLIGASCQLLGAGHVTDDPTTPYARAPIQSYGRIVVQPNAWIGSAAVLVGQVTVGYGAIVAAGALVRGEVPALCMVAGNPARLVKVFDWAAAHWQAATDADRRLDAPGLARKYRHPAQAEFELRLDAHLS